MKKFFIPLCMVWLSTPVFGELRLYSDESNPEFLGCLTCPSGLFDSICNKYTRYGSKYQNSIWNPYQKYGSPYQVHGPWNEYSTSGPKIFDGDGKYYGRFTINLYVEGNNERLNELYHYMDGDLEKVRDVLCKDR